MKLKMTLLEKLRQLPKKQEVSIDNGKDYSYVNAWGQDCLVKDVLLRGSDTMLNSEITEIITTKFKTYITINYLR